LRETPPRVFEKFTFLRNLSKPDLPWMATLLALGDVMW
jgi:hypothetical protein